MTYNEHTLKQIHELSSMHRHRFNKSFHMGCFYCFNEFKCEKITSWSDTEKTALCPKCYIDSVLAFEECRLFGINTKDDFSELLKKMNKFWFCVIED